MAQFKDTLSAEDGNGKTALHGLCQNALATTEMICELAAAAPDS